MTIFRFRQTVIYAVSLCDVGERDEEMGEIPFANEAQQREAAEEWVRSAMPVEYYPEDFVKVEEGPVEFLGAV